MITLEKAASENKVDQHKRETLNALIGEQVIHVLGKAADLFKVQVRPLWANYHRVNILIGKDASAVTVSDSYFLKVDDEGIIVESTPQIKKRY
jgi:hypothetical protein